MAQRYGKLPSEMLREADSFDIMVFDVAVTYHKMQEDKQNKKVDTDMYKQEDLQKIMENARGGEN
jgi:hypothetical protein